MNKPSTEPIIEELLANMDGKLRSIERYYSNNNDILLLINNLNDEIKILASVADRYDMYDETVVDRDNTNNLINDILATINPRPFILYQSSSDRTIHIVDINRFIKAVHKYESEGKNIIVIIGAAAPLKYHEQHKITTIPSEQFNDHVVMYLDGFFTIDQIKTNQNLFRISFNKNFVDRLISNFKPIQNREIFSKIIFDYDVYPKYGGDEQDCYNRFPQTFNNLAPFIKQEGEIYIPCAQMTSPSSSDKIGCNLFHKFFPNQLKLSYTVTITENFGLNHKYRDKDIPYTHSNQWKEHFDNLIVLIKK